MRRRNPAQTPALDVDLLQAPAAILDAERRVVGANAALRGLLGKAPRGVLGKSLEALLEAALIADRPAAPEGPAVYRCGDDRRMRLDLQPLGAGWLALMVDVTEELAAAERLRAAYAIRDQLMHDAEVGTWRYDPERELYFFSSELSLGHEQAADGVPPTTLALLQHEDDVAKDAEIRQRITTEGGAAESEMRYRRADGGWTHLHVRYRAGGRTASGKYEMYGLSQSVTSLAMVRDEATANAQRLRLALRAAGAGVFEYDYRNQRMWLSPELAAMLNPEARRTGASDPFSVFHPDDRQRAVALRGRAVAAGQVDPIDLRLLHVDGDRWVRVCFEVDHDAEGRAVRGVGVILDIHERKRQELALDEARRAAEAATAAKSGFLASVSHEIRTPMNGIVGVLNLLKRERLSAEGADLLEEALGCSEMLSQLINDVLDFSKIEAGKLELAPSPTDPLAVTQGVVNLLTSQAEAKGLYLRLIAPERMGWALVDSVRLRQCLFNVVGNAVKFTERGGVEVRLSLSGAGRRQTLTVEVDDTGIGIPESAREQLFDRFHQADTGATRKFGGTGLGLAISRVLARMMGGDMDYESQEGRGSTFWFSIDAPATQAPAAGPATTFVGAPLEGLRVLLVDDNRINRLVAAKSLEALGAETEAVESGREAIEAVARTGFDLVLMDINMPGMDGLEATRRIRALGSPAAALPVVALTADVMSHHRQAYFDAGMNGVVPKPFSPAQLLAEITRLATGEDEPSQALA